jgi:hypothetical protein
MKFPKEGTTLVRFIECKGQYAVTVIGVMAAAFMAQLFPGATDNRQPWPILVMVAVAIVSAMCWYAAFPVETYTYWNTSPTRWGFATAGWLCLTLAIIQLATGARKVGGPHLAIQSWHPWVHDPTFRRGIIFLGASVVFGLVATVIRRAQRREYEDPWVKIAAWTTIEIMMLMIVMGAEVAPSTADPLVAILTGAVFGLGGLVKASLAWRNRILMSQRDNRSWTEALRLGEIVAALVSLLIALRYAVSTAAQANRAAYIGLVVVYGGGGMLWLVLQQVTLSPESS